jgi:SNF2 family DNA or RNA helicase
VTADLPAYLVPPPKGVRTYGRVKYDEATDSYIVRAEPMVLELAKRVFPGSESGRIGSGSVKFPATRRLVGELNWLMMRYPLEIETPERFAADRDRAVAHALRREENMDVPPISPPATFTGTLYPFQAKDAAYAVKNERVLLANDMGLGKTVEALGAFAACGARPMLVVVPPNLRMQWRRMAGTFLDLAPEGAGAQDLLAGTDLRRDPEIRAEAMTHVLKGLTPYPLPRKPIYIVHYGLLKAWKRAILELAPPVVVFDEIQELRHPDTAKYTAASDIAAQARFAWGLSGTPIYGFGAEMWSVMNIIDFQCLGDRESFSKEWCTDYGGVVVEEPEVLGDHLRREGLMLRRLKTDAEVAIHLPPKRRVVHIVEKDEAKYSSLIAEAVRLASGYASIKDWQAKGLAMRQIEGGVRKASGVAKAPYVAAFVRGLVEAGERVLLCAYHHDVEDVLAEEIGMFSLRVTGRETQKEKDQAIKMFAKGRANVLILALRSTAGLDGLQGAGTCVVFAELDWSPAIHVQAEDRLHRIGMDATRESLLAYYMVSDTGIDETMQEALGVKVGQFVGIMGDAPPTEDDEMMNQRAAERHMDGVIEQLRNRGKRGG